MKATIPSVKGTRDFYPEQMAIRSWLYAQTRKVSELFGYEEYEAPFLERLELYAAKSGEELVMEQSYVFEDRGGEKIALRPELTPSLARMVAQKQRELVYPLRWWSFGPFWRYERPQKGRSREFFQWNIDMIGVDTPEGDAELVALAAAFFKQVGLKPDQVQIVVNNRKLMESELLALGLQKEQFRSVFQLIDRRDKMRPEDWNKYAGEAGMSDAQVQGLKQILSDPNLWEKEPGFRRFFDALEAMGVREYVKYDPSIIRGLDYYTTIVFEAKDVDGGRSIFGGGHYDNLVGDVGGDPLPAVGFAMGDVMIGIVLEKYGLLPDFTSRQDTVLVTVFDENTLNTSLAFAAELRQAGVSAACYPEASKLNKQLKFADRKQMRFVVIIGPDEAAQGQVTVKDLSDRSQSTLPRAKAVEDMRQKLA